MTFPYGRRQFRRDAPPVQPVPGDVYHWKPTNVPHGKYHLCISYDLEFLWLNSPKAVRYRYDIGIKARDVRFIRPRPEEFSFVSSQPIIKVDGPHAFARCNGELIGNLHSETLKDVLVRFVVTPTTEPRDARRVREVLDALRTSGLC